MVLEVLSKVLSKVFNKQNLVILVVFGLIALLISKSDVYIKTTYQGIVLWATAVLPSLLPFLFLTSLLTKSPKIINLSQKLNGFGRFLYGAQGIGVYIRIASILSGYPVGAKIICDLYKDGVISEKQAEKYSTFSSTSGPLFIIGTIGVNIFSNLHYGIIILVSHLLSSLLVGVIFKKLPDNRPIKRLLTFQVSDNPLFEAMHSAIISVVITGGFISVFYTFSALAYDLNLLYPLKSLLSLIINEDLAEGVSLGLVECTKGIVTLANADKGNLSCSLCCALVSFGGLSVWFQSLAYLKTAKVRTRIFISSKILHTIISFLICYILLYLL